MDSALTGLGLLALAGVMIWKRDAVEDWIAFWKWSPRSPHETDVWLSNVAFLILFGLLSLAGAFTQ